MIHSDGVKVTTQSCLLARGMTNLYDRNTIELLHSGQSHTYGNEGQGSSRPFSQSWDIHPKNEIYFSLQTYAKIGKD